MIKVETVHFFISYPDGERQLAQELAREIQAAAKQRTVEATVFLAFRDIRAGFSWQDTIRAEIEKSHCALFLWTNESRISVGQLAELGAFWHLATPRVAICYGVSPASLPPYLEEYQAIFWADRAEHIRYCLNRIASRGMPRSRRSRVDSP